MKPEVINYIKAAQNHGLSDVEIKQNLLDAGWEAQSVDESFASVKAEAINPLPKQAESPKIAQKPEKPAQVAAGPVQAQSQVQHPQIVVSEQQFQTAVNKPSFFKRPLLWVILVLVALLGAGGYYAYAYILNNPVKVWEKFIQAPKVAVYKTNYNFSYNDNFVSNAESAGSQPQKPVRLTLSGGMYINSSDKNNIITSADFNFGMDDGTTQVSRQIKYQYGDKNLYLNIGKVDELTQLFGGKSYDWYLLDFAGLQQLVKDMGLTAASTSLDNSQNQKLQNDIAAIWEQANAVKIDKYLGKEKINNVNTYHFKNTLDKQVVIKNILASIDVISNAQASTGYAPILASDKELVKTAVETLLNKVEVKEFETWIGTKDFRLYKVHFVSNAPSANAIATSPLIEETPLGSTQVKNRDDKRLSDMRQMASVLELYFNDKGGYPEASNGVPQDMISYINPIPTAPLPADGICNDWYNSYWYSPQGEKKEINGKTVYSSYSLSFCLGESTGGYMSGIANLTPSGIKGRVDCPVKDSNCIYTNPIVEPAPTAESVQEQINKLDFSAEFKMDLTYSDYGVVQQLAPPAEYLDVFKELGKMLSNFQSAIVPSTTTTPQTLSN